VRALGAALHADAQAEPLAAAIDDELHRAAALELARVRVFYAIWKKPWMSVNADTYIHDVLARAGADNVCAAAPQRYPECLPSRARELGVDLVLLPSEPWAFSDADRAEALRERWFGERVPVLRCDGRDFCWHGARSAPGLRRAVELLRPFRPAR
jgi:ABC-type Fe3+-hydroxamate transport system substrate-binding protein